MAFKLGRQPRDMSRFAPVFENYLRASHGGLEPAGDHEDIDRASKVTEWPMYCNGPDSDNPPASPDGVGDCTIAEMAHAYTAAAVYANKPQVLFPDSEVIKVYSRNSGYDPETGENDNGCQMQDVLKDQMHNGMTDVNGRVHKVVSYAALGNPNDFMMLSQVLKTFGFVYVGINCPEGAMTNFGPNTVWTDWPDSPIEGGHCIGLHRRMAYGSRIGIFDWASWGALQFGTMSFITAYVEEAWAVITQDWIEANGSSCDGVALSQLEADMRYV